MKLLKLSMILVSIIVSVWLFGTVLILMHVHPAACGMPVIVYAFTWPLYAVRIIPVDWLMPIVGWSLSFCG